MMLSPKTLLGHVDMQYLSTHLGVVIPSNNVNENAYIQYWSLKKREEALQTRCLYPTHSVHPHILIPKRNEAKAAQRDEVKKRRPSSIVHQIPPS